ncbi:1-(5-phosphoribosyl)-5-[(5-phosphoribosylamino)methylideneamino]imidazole-4-carboxamide isomerase [Candidatus Gottesmanbacteria bacterium]|nr:1-(5-phosphoribosyl)-5-[(5-phosphoribosylamino)methylideneamino]imidazole-4-carboxamide isomerase [Candidatus Gottesmanbacteria bacterium]
MLIIPAVDIQKGKVVRLYRGNFKLATTYSDNPVKMAKYWQKTGAKMLHVVDLDGARVGRMKNYSLIKKIVKAVSIPTQVGGGVDSELLVDKLLSSGVSRVILGTVALESESLLKTLVDKYGSCIAVALDVNNYSLSKRGWQKMTGKNIFYQAKRLETLGVKRFIYTDIARDGTLTSPDCRLIRKLVNSINCPIIVSGGISTIKQIKKIKALKAEGVIIGKALYEKRLNPKEVFNVN